MSTILQKRAGTTIDTFTPTGLKPFLESAESDVKAGDVFEIQPGTAFGGIDRIYPAFAGNRDSSIIVTGSGWTAYTELMGTVTWAEEDTAWQTSTVYSVGDIRVNAGSTYCCRTAHTSGDFATDLAANKWSDVGGTVFVDDLTKLSGTLNSAIVYCAIDGRQDYSERWVGLTSQSYAPIFEREFEWSAGPNLWSPTKFWIRADIMPGEPNGVESIRIAIDYGLFRLRNGNDYWLFRDIEATDLSCVAGVSCTATAAVRDLRGYAMRNVHTTRSGSLTQIQTYNSPIGGPEFAVRGWRVENCTATRTNRQLIGIHNAGVGIARGVIGTDCGLSFSAGYYYIGSSGKDENGDNLDPGDSYDTNDDIYIVDCWGIGTGLYSEQNGKGNFYEQDHNGTHYMDGRAKNIYFHGGGCSNRPLEIACQCNSGGGHVEWRGYTAINMRNLLTVSDNTDGQYGTTAMYNVSAVNMQTSILNYGNSIYNNHIAQNVGAHCAGVDKTGVNLSTLNATVVLDNCYWEGDGMGLAGGSGFANITTNNCVAKDNPDSETTFFESLTSARIPAGSDLIDNGTAPIEACPAIEIGDASDDCWIEHGLTQNAPFAVAVTIRPIASANYALMIGSAISPNYFYGLWQNTSGHFKLIKVVAGTQYATAVSTGISHGLDTENRVGIKVTSDYKVYLWVNGQKIANGVPPNSNEDDTTPLTIIGLTPPYGTVSLAATLTGSIGLNAAYRDLIVVQDEPSDAEMEKL